MTTALLVVGILVFLIVVHELGHFLASKFFKVRVEEFGIGYPPRAFTFGTWGGTEYTLNWIPFGGFVRLFGEHGETTSQGSFAAAPKYAQAIILVAGVTANALAAWLLFAGALHAGIPRAIPEGKALTEVQLFVNRVIDGSPAAVAGLRSGDQILSIKDATSGAEATLLPSKVVEFIGARGGKPLEITYRRAEEVHTASVIPAHAVVEDMANRPAVGFGMIIVSDQALSWPSALREGLVSTSVALQDTARGLWSLIRDAATGDPNLQNIVGPVGLVDFVGNASRHGFGHVLALAGFISINLSVINLIPIPALDGGRLMLLGIETVIRRPPHRLTVQIANFIGVTLIVFLMISVTFNDIARLLA
ncbi:MAG TPA: site-2 protease family protein [Candidatus Paceibacterota bacterium]|nr:site-2 protease family protein [Candidatus Paceibacterota bacterium]